MEARSTYPNRLAAVLGWLHRAFDAVATWVTQLSWWKFALFAALCVIAASILQDELFSGDEIVTVKTKGGKQPQANITIDDSGIHFNPKAFKKPGEAGASANASADPDGEAKADAAAKAEEAQADARDAANADATPDSAAPRPAAPPAPPAAGALPAPPAPPAPEINAEDAAAAAKIRAMQAQQAAKAAQAAQAAAALAAKLGSKHGATSADGEVHIDLPAEISEQLSNAIEQRVEEQAEEKVTQYHKQASTWFKSFIYLLLLALLGTKALVGGKKRAEMESATAVEVAERESMQRQLSEAKMQMMQAQVEPHFLFNTLASVEYLIETDAPRAAAMQRSLIQYLRAVLPQMRDNTVISNLGRETDMVRAYLNLLKMRMEDRLTVDIQLADGLRTAAFPPMMLQSLVENAIKHGIECKPEGGTLRVFADVANGKLRVIVSDNGVGFGVMPSNGTGTGLTNIRERLKMLFGETATLHIGPNEPTGVVATIEVPYQVVK